MSDVRPDRRLPPHDPAAQRAVLGSMLRLNRCIPDVALVLRKEDFYGDAHQKVFDCVLALADRGMPADVVTLAQEAHRRGWTEDVGYPLIAQLHDAAPTAANVAYYAGIVRDHAMLRSLLEAASLTLAEAQAAAAPAEEILEAAEKRIYAVAARRVQNQTRHVSEFINQAASRLDDRAGGGKGLLGVPTGFVELDAMTGGLHGGELVVVGARPSVGKTSFALHLARHAALVEGVPALFVSLEQAGVELADRMISAQARVDGVAMRYGSMGEAEQGRAADAVRTLREMGLWIDDTPGQGMLSIAANARRLRLKHDVGLVVVDYLQLIDPENRRANRSEQVALVSRRLKLLARELGVPVVACAQVGRSAEDRKDNRPRLADLRESGGIEADGDTVMLLHRPELYDKEDMPGLIEVIVAKQRNGPTGEVTLRYHKQWSLFEDHRADGGADPFGAGAQG